MTSPPCLHGSERAWNIRLPELFQRQDARSSAAHRPRVRCHHANERIEIDGQALIARTMNPVSLPSRTTSGASHLKGKAHNESFSQSTGYHPSNGPAARLAHRRSHHIRPHRAASGGADAEGSSPQVHALREDLWRMERRLVEVGHGTSCSG